MAVGKLPVRSCLVDGEAIVCDENGLAVFDLIRRHGALASAVLRAFDLLELDGRDLRREPIEERKRLLGKLLRGSHLSIVLNEHFTEDGAIVFSRGLQARLRGHRLEAAWFPLSLRPLTALGEGQKPESARRHAGGGGGLGRLTRGKHG
jgi:ATP dependent DNA ligase-like protein